MERQINEEKTDLKSDRKISCTCKSIEVERKEGIRKLRNKRKERQKKNSEVEKKKIKKRGMARVMERDGGVKVKENLDKMQREKERIKGLGRGLHKIGPTPEKQRKAFSQLSSIDFFFSFLSPGSLPPSPLY